jgi:hypothetical protein
LGIRLAQTARQAYAGTQAAAPSVKAAAQSPVKLVAANDR